MAAMSRVVDVGAGGDPDPRADETADLYSEADHQFDLNDDWPFPDASVEGLVARHVVEHLGDVTHFFNEAGRVLESGGWLEVTVPVGADADADPDHEQRWTYRTPEVYCRAKSRENGRPWDPDPPFVLVSRTPDVWFFRPFRWATPLLQTAAHAWPAEAVRRCSSGEITARYRRVPR